METVGGLKSDRKENIFTSYPSPWNNHSQLLIAVDPQVANWKYEEHCAKLPRHFCSSNNNRNPSLCFCLLPQNAMDSEIQVLWLEAKERSFLCGGSHRPQYCTHCWIHLLVSRLFLSPSASHWAVNYSSGS